VQRPPVQRVQPCLRRRGAASDGFLLLLAEGTDSSGF
jgi:hypothetical protein